MVIIQVTVLTLEGITVITPRQNIALTSGTRANTDLTRTRGNIDLTRTIRRHQDSQGEETYLIDDKNFRFLNADFKSLKFNYLISFPDFGNDPIYPYLIDCALCNKMYFFYKTSWF